MIPVFLEQEHIKIEQKLGNVQTELTDRTVSGGNMVFETAPETLERNFDKLTMQVQQLAEKQDLAVTVDIFDDTQAVELIPSIRKAVSDCQTAVETAAANAATSETNTAAMLGTKANVNNFSAGKGVLAGLGMPSNRYVDLTLGTNGAGYTAPADLFRSGKEIGYIYPIRRMECLFISDLFMRKETNDVYRLSK